MRDCRLEKVDSMQDKLDELIKATEEDKQAFRERENDLTCQLNQKEMELNKLRHVMHEGSDIYRLENERKTHVIEGMQ